MPFLPLSRVSQIARLILIALVALVLVPSNADAQRGKRSANRQLAAVSNTDPKPAPAARTLAPAVPLVAAVSLNAQQVTIYSGTDIVARSSISSGMSGYATPTGVFSILQKNRYHESNIYDNAPMPFMQRLTWSGVAFHAGKLPGYPASHGCVRLPYDFAERLFGMLRMGTRVVVAPEVVTPQPIVHAGLPKPIYTPVMLVASVPQLLPAGLTLASTGAPQPERVVTEQLLSPPQWALHEKQRAHAAFADAQVEARRQIEAATEAIASADEATAERIHVEKDLASFRSLRERASLQAQRATDDETRVQAEASVHAFDDAITDAASAIVALKAGERLRLDASFAAVRRAREAEDASERADGALKVANRGAEPITVFVSRAENRVLVRQGFHTILEGEVTIRDPQLPLGTHVMTAIASLDETSGLQWTGLTLSDGSNSRGTAAQALDRITLAPKIAEEIGRRAWTGATLLISDQPTSKETGKGTDFVILTK